MPQLAFQLVFPVPLAMPEQIGDAKSEIEKNKKKKKPSS